VRGPDGCVTPLRVPELLQFYRCVQSLEAKMKVVGCHVIRPTLYIFDDFLLAVHGNVPNLSRYCVFSPPTNSASVQAHCVFYSCISCTPDRLQSKDNLSSNIGVIYYSFSGHRIDAAYCYTCSWYVSWWSLGAPVFSAKPVNRSVRRADLSAFLSFNCT